MIKIRESDSLWKYYKRYYQYERSTPEPRTLCNYFWTAVGGMLKTWAFDTSFFTLMVPIWFVASCLVYSASVTKLKFWGFAGILVLCAVAVAAGVSLPVIRWFRYWILKEKEWVNGLTLYAVAFLSVGWLISIIALEHDSSGKVVIESWRWWHLFYGIGLELLVIAGLIVTAICWKVFFSDETSIGHNVRQYLKAVKDRVCPLVDPPDSYKEEKRQIETNCGDG